MDSAQDNSNLPIESQVMPTSHDTPAQLQKLSDTVAKAKLPDELRENAKAMVGRLELVANQSSFFAEYDTISRYINWICALPWGAMSEDVLDLNHAKQVLDKNHYGLNDVKEKILEFLSIMILTRTRSEGNAGVIARAPILSLVGLAGVGKTSIAYSIAEALGRKIERIPFGGMGAASQLRGKSRMSPDSEPGLVVKALKRAGTSNPVILLDEIDRVSSEARADIMGVLVEILDPNQNKAYLDHFIDYPIDLSNVLFIATSNNTKDISTAVLDRLEIIQMPSYTDEEKTYIGKNYLLPQILKESGLVPQEFGIRDDAWEEYIVRPLGYDPGIRGLHRILEGMVRKVVFYLLQGKIPQGQQFLITPENVKQFIPQW